MWNVEVLKESELTLQYQKCTDQYIMKVISETCLDTTNIKYQINNQCIRMHKDKIINDY